MLRRPGRDDGPPSQRVSAALRGIDDPVVLIDDQPVRIGRLWRELIDEALDDRCGSVLLVHPTSWPQRRVDVVVAAAAAITDEVVAMPRAGRFAGDRVVIEVDDDVITVIRGDGHAAFGRDQIAEVAAVAEAAASQMSGRRTPILLDVPPELTGGSETAAAIRAALPGHVMTASPVMTERGRISLHPLAIAVCLVVITAVILIAVMHHNRQPHTAEMTATVVEGRIAVAVPPGWTVERITRGPGSRRVRVSSPSDPVAALHITEAYAPDTTLADAAESLAAAAADQPAGVITDFRADDRVAGRPAVTWRESRPGRVVRWVVVLDGPTRISIGCQSAAGGGDALAAACLAAVGSARDLGGTGSAATASK